MSSTARYIVRTALVGIAAADAVLIAALPGITWDDLTMSLLIGLGNALAYAGIGAGTSVEPSVGKGS